MPRLILILVTLFFAVPIEAQQRKEFQFWISSLDKAAYGRVTYHVTEDSIIVKHGPYDFIYFAKDYEKDKVVFNAKLDNTQKEMFYKIGLTVYEDSLKSQYTNLCIIDGTILHFHFEFGNIKKSTTLSNYYLDKMNPFVDFVNQTVPKKYQIYYNNDDLEKRMKDCPPNRILD